MEEPSRKLNRTVTQQFQANLVNNVANASVEEYLTKRKSVATWIADVMDKPKIVSNGVLSSILDGVIPCGLLAKVFYSKLLTPHKRPRNKFQMRENLSFFHQRCVKLGVSKQGLFDMKELLGDSPREVPIIRTFHELGLIANDQGFTPAYKYNELRDSDDFDAMSQYDEDELIEIKRQLLNLREKKSSSAPTDEKLTSLQSRRRLFSTSPKSDAHSKREPRKKRNTTHLPKKKVEKSKEEEQEEIDLPFDNEEFRLAAIMFIQALFRRYDEALKTNSRRSSSNGKKTKLSSQRTKRPKSLHDRLNSGDYIKKSSTGPNNLTESTAQLRTGSIILAPKRNTRLSPHSRKNRSHTIGEKTTVDMSLISDTSSEGSGGSSSDMDILTADFSEDSDDSFSGDEDDSGTKSDPKLLRKLSTLVLQAEPKEGSSSKKTKHQLMSEARKRRTHKRVDSIRAEDTAAAVKVMKRLSHVRIRSGLDVSGLADEFKSDMRTSAEALEEAKMFNPQPKQKKTSRKVNSAKNIRETQDNRKYERKDSNKSDIGPQYKRSLSKKKSMRVLKARSLIIAEIMETEESYVRDLQMLIHHFKKDLMSLVTPEQLKKIFLNADMIMALNIDICDSLVSQRDLPPESQMVGEIFDAKAAFLRTYKIYCAGYEQSIELVAKLAKKSKEISAITNVPDKAPLSFYLIKPVQRVCKYPLLLEELLKKTEKTHPDYDTVKAAVVKVRKIVDEINEATRTTQNLSKMQEIHSSFVQFFWSGSGSDKEEGLLSPDRRFIMEGRFLKPSHRQSTKTTMVDHWYRKKKNTYKYYMFNDMIVYGRLVSKSFFPRGALIFTEVEDISMLSKYAVSIKIRSVSDGVFIMQMSDEHAAKRFCDELRVQVEEISSKTPTQGGSS